MNKIKTIIKFELIRYFTSPLAYVFLISFLILSGSLAIYFGHFFVNGQANLWGLFDFQPWIYLLFIPSISMRSWAEEFRSKNIVQILTTPISITDLVWGKFFASWLFIIIAIILTFPFWITANYFGSPDNNVILVSYLGCFILAGAILAISQTMSALTKNPISALVLAVFVNLLFFWSGFEYVLFWARSLFNETLVNTIISFSFLTHFSSLSRGLVELRDLVFFSSLIVFFNLTTIVIVSLRTAGTSGLISTSSTKHATIVLILLFIGFLGLNIFANNLLRQINYDFTEEKYLTLTKNTKNILQKLERPVIARLYYSPILEKRNPEIRQIFENVKLLLKQYKSHSKGNFDYRIYSPKFLDKTEDRALADGIQPIPLIDINQNALFGISFSDALTNKSVIPFLSPERLIFLEQDITTNIYKLQHKKKKLGILSSIPVGGDVRLNDVMVKKWEIIKQIEQLYDIQYISTTEDLDKEFDVFMLIHPYNLDEKTVEKLKKQKKVLVLLDVADEASRLYLPESGLFTASYLSDLANYWGIEFYDGNVAADFNNSITVDETIDYKKNPSFTQDLLQFKVTEQDFNHNHRVTYKLGNILFSSASMVMPKRGANISFFPLIKTSSSSALMDVSFVKKSKTPREILENFVPQNNAIVLAGEFLSNDPNNPFDVIVVGDTDFIYDDFWARKLKFLSSSYSIPLFDSANFILNSLDYLIDNDDLISLRGKSVKKRPLYLIDNMRKTNTYRYKIRENDILHAIDMAKREMQELTAKKNFEERSIFTSDELAIIGKIRKEINLLRQQLSDLRIEANDNISIIEANVKFFNIYFVSLTILLLLLIFHLWKKRLKIKLSSNYFRFDISMFKLSIWIFFICVFAGISIYYDNKNMISDYEDVLVFNDFKSKINEIKTIKLQNNKQTLTFYLKDGIWSLKEFPDLPVYQERIRSFLLAIANMTFYEKKSDKVEDMQYFGISSLQNQNSPTIEVTLSNDNNLVLEKFDIGWYDLDLGRGSKAAYIRIGNEFQVWLVDVDFYDLSLNENNWVYSSLWNLRFGRFISIDGNTDDLTLMTFVKNLLNTQILSIQKDPTVHKLATFNIIVENENNFELSFYKSKTNKYYAKYNFIKKPNGSHLQFFVPFIEGKYLEISKESWEKIKNDTH